LEFFSSNLSMRPAPIGLDTAPFVSFPMQPDCQIDVGIVWSGSHVGEVHPSMEIGDRVWSDLDCDGVQDPGEPGIPNVVIELRDAGGRTLASTVTATTGEYRFGGLESGRPYTVAIAGGVAGSRPTAARIGARPPDDPAFDEALVPYAAIDSDGVPAGGAVVASVTLSEPGISDHSIDFGWAPSSCGPAPSG
jgi:hypothetical protein